MRRRAYLRILPGGALAPAVAGCVGDDGDEMATEDDGSAGHQGPMLGDRELDAAYPLRLLDDAGEVVLEVHYHGDGEAGWHYQPLELAPSETHTFEIRVVDADGERLDLVSAYDVSYEVGEDGVDLGVAIEGADLAFSPMEAGDSEFRLIVEGEDDRWETPWARVVVDG